MSGQLLTSPLCKTLQTLRAGQSALRLGRWRLKLWLMALFSTLQSTPCCEKRPNGKTSLAMLLRLPCLKCCMQPSLRPPSDAQELTIGDTPLGFSFADCQRFLGAPPVGLGWTETQRRFVSQLAPWSVGLEPFLEDPTQCRAR